MSVRFRPRPPAALGRYLHFIHRDEPYQKDGGSRREDLAAEGQRWGGLIQIKRGSNMENRNHIEDMEAIRVVQRHRKIRTMEEAEEARRQREKEEGEAILMQLEAEDEERQRQEAAMGEQQKKDVRQAMGLSLGLLGVGGLYWLGAIQPDMAWVAGGVCILAGCFTAAVVAVRHRLGK